MSRPTKQPLTSVAGATEMHMPPAYEIVETSTHASSERQPLLVTRTVVVDSYPQQQSPTHIFGSVLSAVLCCFPLGLVATCFSVRTAMANSEGRVSAASHHSGCARGWMRAAVLAGTVIALVSLILHGIIVGVVLSEANVGFRTGFEEGFGAGKTTGATYYNEQVQAHRFQKVFFPHPVPGSANVFDVSRSNPFWQGVGNALKTGDWEALGHVFGNEIGKVEGFRSTFCPQPYAFCTEEEKHVRYPHLQVD